MEGAPEDAGRAAGGTAEGKPATAAAPVVMEDISCPLCGKAERDAVVSAPDPDTGIGGAFQVVRCRACGMTYTSPRPTPETIGVFYPPDYGPFHGREGGEGRRRRRHQKTEAAVLRGRYGYPGPRSPLRAALGAFVLRARRKRLTWVPFVGRGRLLDFGCGAKDFLPRMRAYGFQAEGMDLSAEVAHRVERETGIRVHVGTLPHPDIRPGSFDVITMWNALEHVHDPRAVAAACREALSPGGLLIAAVPNIDSWGFRAFGEAWHPLDLPRHLLHFTPSTLRRLLEAEGFRVREMQHIGRDGWMRLSAKLALRKGRRTRWSLARRWKPLALALAAYTERTGQADMIRVTAERAG